VIGVLVAFWVGNSFQHAVAFQLDVETPLTPNAWWDALRTSIVTPAEGEPAPPPALYWISWTVAFALLMGLAVRPPRLAPDFALFVRLGVCAAVTFLLIPRSLREEFAWIWPAATIGTTLAWQSLDRLGKSSPGGWLPAVSAAILLVAAGVILHAHSARLADVALISAGALIGLAAIAWLAKADASAAAPLIAIGLSALMLNAYHVTFSEVPVWSFLLVAASPLGLLPLLLVPSDRRAGGLFVLLAWALALAPAIAGLVLAMRVESLSFE